MCKSYEEVLSYLDKLPVFNPNDIIEKKQIIALDSLKELLERIGNPQDSLKYIHVGGTNGKGSTCVFIRQILIEEGYLVGGFNSPELLDFREQITVNNIEISKEEVTVIEYPLGRKTVKHIAYGQIDHAKLIRPYSLELRGPRIKDVGIPYIVFFDKNGKQLFKILAYPEGLQFQESVTKLQ